MAPLAEVVLIKDTRVYVAFQLVEQPHLGSMRTCGTTYRSGIIEEHNRVLVVPTTVTLLGGTTYRSGIIENIIEL